MAEEFVDLYEVLDLPLDADRGTVRKRINERYLDAQRNIDHRNFATRVKFQELFEVTLPQARYILLDDGRRDEYNRLVNAFRGTGQSAGAAPPAPTPAPAGDTIPLSTGGFSLEAAPDAISGNAPVIPPLPQTPVDPAQLAQEREELWKKWKTGLEAALTTEEGDKPKARGAVTSAPTSFSVAAPPPEAAPAPTPVAIPASPSPVAPAPKTAPRPKVTISLGSTDKQAEEEAAEAKAAAGTSIFGEEVETGPSKAEIEARRNDHKLQITREILVNVSLIWGIIGAALIIVPGLIGLIAAVGHYYPRGAAPILKYPSMVLWIGGFLLMGIAAFFASRELSQKMRQKKASELSALSYEEVLRRHHPKA